MTASRPKLLRLIFDVGGSGMKIRSLSSLCFTVGAFMCGLVHAQSLPPKTGSLQPASELREAMSVLIRADGKKAASAQEEVRKESSGREPVVVLTPVYVVEGKKLPELKTPRESPVAKVLRTGTIFEHVGKKKTIRLWASGDAGVVLSMKW